MWGTSQHRRRFAHAATIDILFAGHFPAGETNGHLQPVDLALALALDLEDAPQAARADHFENLPSPDHVARAESVRVGDFVRHGVGALRVGLEAGDSLG